MHELHITKQVIDSIIAECRKNKITEPRKILVELGALTTYKKDHMKTNFDLLKHEVQMLRNAELVVNELQGEVECNKCKKESTVKDPLVVKCAHCDSRDVNVLHGSEIIIKSIETGD